MSFLEITGQDPDTACLHCVLPPVIEKFEAEHPKPAAQILGELLQVAAEYLASTAPAGEFERAIEGAKMVLEREARHAMQGYCTRGLR